MKISESKSFISFHLTPSKLAPMVMDHRKSHQKFKRREEFFYTKLGCMLQRAN